MIDVLLPTYNAGRYLDDFLASLEQQQCDTWRLMARDDASSDDTSHILAKWKLRLGERMHILDDSGMTNLQCYGNFSRLLAESVAPYVMLADPDDVWKASKIAVTLQRMKRTEGKYGVHTPCLVHTDLEMVDSSLSIKQASLWRYQGLRPSRRRTLSRFLMENTVWGCTLMANRALVDLAGSIPESSFHADWWIAMVASAFGQIQPVRQSTILWRRHGGNASDVSAIEGRTLAAIRDYDAARSWLHEIIRQNQWRAASFLARYKYQLSQFDVDALEAFLELLDCAPSRRKLSALSHGFCFTSIRRTLGMLVFL